ncbi:unnamed protein product [Rotaria magnacalcarata]|uniref:beta-N-acetylhexosaminidase n=1 Tax=Rotaria magnacalcarata TaxID=392030 RepID=A0A816WE54_9BILA|nr:unnamed protein product [Rotaria magnacalcarata]CAF2096094.1 unnamed protein product [Rotaria magnacalcarata]CAF2132018.1 unnamed protein product [Rotaria magnacalcarata]CAF2192626.1 unnamed protein product [Rotaria magnacalcarata]
MFARRNLRRNLTITISLPFVLLTLFVVHKNRDIIFSDNKSHKYHEHTADFSQDIINPIYHVRSKRSTTGSKLSTIHIDERTQNPNPIMVNPFTMPFINTLNNHRQIPEYHSIEQIPYPVINTKNLERFVHLDLKGAAPKLDYYQKLFPFLKRLGATGLLIEYEDMFPFVNHLAIIKHGLAYSKHDIQLILQLADMNGLKIMPLLQVYGHLEYVLKLKEFMHLREDKRYPQVITPCLEESYKLIFEMIDQMLSLHPFISYFHMGCDEVYYRLVHPQCVYLNFHDDADLFIRHVTRVAKYIKSKRPDIKLFIWHDMLSQLANSGYNNITELNELIVPMVWAYVDDVKPWFDDGFWMRFSVFREVWVASSFKGSSGEITTMSYIGHHQRNQQTWLETMHIASNRHKVNFSGIAITGWSRYDHMLSLCELLPSSIPSLAYVLQTIVFGHIDNEKNVTISTTLLGCNQIPLWEKPMFTTFVSCSFPGHELYEMMHQYDSILRLYDETMSFVRSFVTDIHIRQNYIHYKRSQECLQRLIYLEDQMIYFINAFQRVSFNFFTVDIGSEWLQTYFMRKFKEVQYRTNFIERKLKTQLSWSQRPLPNNTAFIVAKRRNFTTLNFSPVLE